MRRDGNLSAHDDSWEKVLGYTYNAVSEKIRIAPLR